VLNYMKKIEEDREVRQMLSPEEVHFGLLFSLRLLCLPSQF